MAKDTDEFIRENVPRGTASPTNPLDYTSGLSNKGLGAGFADPGQPLAQFQTNVGFTPEGNVDPYASFRRSGGISYKEPSGVNTSFSPFIFGSSDAISQTGRFDEGANFREPSVNSFMQAKYNDVYAPEGIIANEVMQRAIEDYPFHFHPNIIPLSKDDALLSSAIDESNMLEEAKNNILNQTVSIDQITGDIDPVQTIRNALALEPKIANVSPEIQNLQTNASNLRSQPSGYIYLNQGFKSPYLDKGVSPSDLDAIIYGGENVQNITKAIGSLLNGRSIDPELYKVSYPFVTDEGGVPLRDSFGNFVKRERPFQEGGEVTTEEFIKKNVPRETSTSKQQLDKLAQVSQRKKA